MGLLTLEQIEREVNRYAKLIGASGYDLPTYGHTEDFARPHIEVDARGYHFVVVERGQEYERFTTSDLDALLYHIFQDVTFSLAGSYELKHRVSNKDNRRLHFQKQVELLAQLSPHWADLERAEHEAILKQHPFDDAVDARVKLTVKLREQGHTPDEAWKLACERYPLPKGETL